jgi:predicted ATPase
MKKIYAFCYRNGIIKFGPRMPKGALPLFHGGNRPVRELTSAVARHGYKRGVLLVPGIPEAKNDDEALKACEAFVAWARPQLASYKLTWLQKMKSPDYYGRREA